MDGIEERLLFNEYILRNFTDAAADSSAENENDENENKAETASQPKERTLASVSYTPLTASFCSA